MKYDQVIRAGISGSGNTLLTLILNYLLGKSKVVGTHRYIDNLEEPRSLVSNNIGIIIPCRDFRSVLANTLRRTRWAGNERNITYVYRTFFTPQYMYFNKFKTKYPHQEDVLWVMYNRFFDGYDYLIDELRDFLSIEITQDQRDEIKNSFSLQASKDKIEELQLTNWRDVDNSTQLHGNHIGTGDPESWKTFFNPELHEFITELMLTELIAYGYEMGTE